MELNLDFFPNESLPLFDKEAAAATGALPLFLDLLSINNINHLSNGINPENSEKMFKAIKSIALSLSFKRLADYTLKLESLASINTLSIEKLQEIKKTIKNLNSKSDRFASRMLFDK